MFDFFLQSLLKSKLKDVPPEMREQILSAAKKNPELLSKIASSVQEKMTRGVPQMKAIEEVVKENQEVLSQILKPEASLSSSLK